MNKVNVAVTNIDGAMAVVKVMEERFDGTPQNVVDASFATVMAFTALGIPKVTVLEMVAEQLEAADLFITMMEKKVAEAATDSKETLV